MDLEKSNMKKEQALEKEKLMSEVNAKRQEVEKNTIKNQMYEKTLGQEALEIERKKEEVKKELSNEKRKIEKEKELIKAEKEQFEKYKENKERKIELANKELEQKCDKFKGVIKEFNTRFRMMKED